YNSWQEKRALVLEGLIGLMVMKSGTKSRLWTFEEALALVCDESQALSRPVIAFLSGAGRAEVGQFADCWGQASPERRRELISAMVEMAEADFELDFNAIFRWSLQSEDPVVRERAIEGLWEDEQPGLIDPLLRLMKDDPAPEVRAQAAASLGRFALQAELGDLSEGRAALVRQGLLEVIDSQSEIAQVRRRAIESIAYMSEAPVDNIIDRAYADPDEKMRLSAVFAMGRTADPHWAEAVRRELKSASPAMRYEAARAAGEIALKWMAGELIALLTDRDAEVRQMAVWALGQVGGGYARRALQACQASRDEAMREAAEEALSELGFGSAPLDMFYYEAEGGAEAEPETEADEE
ncbi:MAG TPA: HEAT repeat domain-containing protein, partial [Anaerolineae bacterium]|nr:HEAT repeat domain-containing protein [Anaerolineae bacterium]